MINTKNVNSHRNNYPYLGSVIRSTAVAVVFCFLFLYLGAMPAQAAGSAPTVTTTTPSSITSDSAESGGNVTDDGGATVTARGVCWSTSADPTTADSHTTDGTGTGSFTSSITGLNPGTTYHVRAYATNSVGTSYGSDQTFDTLAPEIDVQGNGNSIVDGDNDPSTTDGTDFGRIDVDVTSEAQIFTIKNTGTADLNISAPTIEGTDKDDFVVTPSGITVIEPGESTTFSITFTPSAVKTHNATINITNNDPDENPYDFAIQGTGKSSLPPEIMTTVPEKDTEVDWKTGQTFSITFSKPMNTKSVMDAKVSLEDLTTGQTLGEIGDWGHVGSGEPKTPPFVNQIDSLQDLEDLFLITEVKWEDDDKKVSFKLNLNLFPGHTYKITVGHEDPKPAAKEAAGGQELDKEYAWEFTTKTAAATAKEYEGVSIPQADSPWKSTDRKPYKIKGGCTIESSTVLTIEPGVVIEFDADATLTVKGTIIANGQKYDAIDIQNSGIIFNSGATGTFTNCLFRNATTSSAIVNNGTLNINQCRITNNNIGIECNSGSDTTIKNTVIADNAEYGIDLNTGGTLTVQLNDFHGNGNKNIRNNSGAELNAEYNWWGIINAENTTTTFEGEVDFNPMLASSGAMMVDEASQPKLPTPSNPTIAVDGYDGIIRRPTWSLTLGADTTPDEMIITDEPSDFQETTLAWDDFPGDAKRKFLAKNNITPSKYIYARFLDSSTGEMSAIAYAPFYFAKYPFLHVLMNDFFEDKVVFKVRRGPDENDGNATLNYDIDGNPQTSATLNLVATTDILRYTLDAALVSAQIDYQITGLIPEAGGEIKFPTDSKRTIKKVTIREKAIKSKDDSVVQTASETLTLRILSGSFSTDSNVKVKKGDTTGIPPGATEIITYNVDLEQTDKKSRKKLTVTLRLSEADLKGKELNSLYIAYKNCQDCDWQFLSRPAIDGPDTEGKYDLTFTINHTSDIALLSSDISEISLTLAQGYNSIAIPHPTGTQTSKSLLFDIFVSDVVTSWDPVAQLWGEEDFILDDGTNFLGDNPFDIAAGAGYFIQAESDDTDVLGSYDDLTAVVPLSFKRGLNLVAIPYSKGYTSHELIEDIPCEEVISWDEVTQLWGDSAFLVDDDTKIRTYNEIIIY